MPPKFLLDENVEGALWDAIILYNQSNHPPISAIRVGDTEDLPLSSSDPQILLWAQRNRTIIVSHDISTFKGHLAAHLLAGGHCPGLFLFSHHAEIPDIVGLLAVASQSDNPLEWQDLIEHLG